MKDSKFSARKREGDVKIAKASIVEDHGYYSVWEHGGTGREVSRGNR